MYFHDYFDEYRPIKYIYIYKLCRIPKCRTSKTINLRKTFFLQNHFLWIVINKNIIFNFERSAQNYSQSKFVY